MRSPAVGGFTLPRIVAIVVGLVVAGGAAYGAWSLLGGTKRDTSIEGDDVVAVAGSAETPKAASPSDVTPPSSLPDAAPTDVAYDAVAREGEVLPPRRVGERPSVVPISKDYVGAADPTIAGDALIKAIVGSRVAPIRWDAAETRDRFTRSRFRMPPARALPGGQFGILLIEVAPVVGEDGKFTARLDDKALWIGVKTP